LPCDRHCHVIASLPCYQQLLYVHSSDVFSSASFRQLIKLIRSLYIAGIVFNMVRVSALKETLCLDSLVAVKRLIYTYIFVALNTSKTKFVIFHTTSKNINLGRH
jgi:hypothetical protein